MTLHCYRCDGAIKGKRPRRCPSSRCGSTAFYRRVSPRSQSVALAHDVLPEPFDPYADQPAVPARWRFARTALWGFK